MGSRFDPVRFLHERVYLREIVNRGQDLLEMRRIGLRREQGAVGGIGLTRVIADAAADFGGRSAAGGDNGGIAVRSDGPASRGR